MRDLSAQTGVDTTDPNYLNGKIVALETLISEGVNGDLVQFFQKLMSLAGLTANDLPDNEANGYQLIQALRSFGSNQLDIIEARVEIGAWDMSTFQSTIVNYTPPTGYEVIGAEAWIFEDGSTNFLRPLNSVEAAASPTPNGSIVYYDVSAERFTLLRTDAGLYNSTSYNDGVQNRGYLTIKLKRT